MDPSTVVQKKIEDLKLVQRGEVLGPRSAATTEHEEVGLKVRELSIAMRKDELLRLLQAGNTTRRAAEVLGLSITTVRTYIRCPEFQQLLMAKGADLWARIDEEIRVSKLTTTMRIEELSEKALEKLDELLNSDDEAIVFRASSDILDRNTKTSKQHKEEINKNVVIVDPAQLILAAAAAREMEARQNGNRSVGPGTDTSSESQ